MAFRTWILEDEKEVDASSGKSASMAEAPRSQEENAWGVINGARDEIVRGGVWEFSPEVALAEKAITEAYDELMAGRGSMEDLQAACERWRRAGSGYGEESKYTSGQLPKGALFNDLD